MQQARTPLAGSSSLDPTRRDMLGLAAAAASLAAISSAAPADEKQDAKPEPGKPKYIVDMRCRPHTKEFPGLGDNPAAKLMLKTGEKLGVTRKGVQSAEDAVAACKKLGIIRGVITARDLRRVSGGYVSNDYIAELQKSFPEFYIGIPSVDPGVGAAKCINELQRTHETLGLRGVSLDPYMIKIPCDDPALYPIYGYIQKLKQPCFIATGLGIGDPGTTLYDVHPMRLDKVCRDFPELKIFNNHGSYPFVRDSCLLALRHPNYYFDCAPYEPFPGAEEYWAWANAGLTSRRHCFASANPFGNFEVAVPFYEKISLLPEVREAIMWKNANEFLNLGLA